MQSIYVGNLPFGASADDVRKLFTEYGTVSRVTMMGDARTERSRGFGFVEMPNEEEGNAAIVGVNGSDMGGRELKVGSARRHGTKPERRTGFTRRGGKGKGRRR